MTNRRERILLGMVALLVVLYGVRWLGDRFIFEPLREQRLQAEQLSQEIRVKKKQIQTLDDAQRELDAWRSSSLPPDVALAQTQYEDYLFDLVEQHAVRDWVVEPGTVFEDEHMTRFPFRVTGRISLANLTELLHQVYQTQLLHRIRRLDLQRDNDSDQDIRMVLSIDGITVRGAQPRMELIPAALAGGGPLDGTAREEFAMIVENDILTPYRETPPVTAPVAPATTVSVDGASFIHLTGTPYWGSSRQAWLHDRNTNAHWVLEAGQSFDVAGIQGTVVAIEDTHVELKIDGKRWLLPLSHNLRQLTAVE